MEQVILSFSLPSLDYWSRCLGDSIKFRQVPRNKDSFIRALRDPRSNIALWPPIKGALARGGLGRIGVHTLTYVENSSGSCTCGYRSNREGEGGRGRRRQRRSAAGYWSALPPPFFHPRRHRFWTFLVFLRVPPRRSGPVLRVAPPPVTSFRNKPLFARLASPRCQW